MKRLPHLLLMALLSGLFCSATLVPRLSLEDMVARSELIVAGQVTRTWAAWDGEHRFIWTHSEIAVRDVVKGERIEKTIVSEPGGVVDGVRMTIVGMPTYAPGEQVMLFLDRMPNGYLRSAGVGQGKFLISAQGRIHLTHSGADVVKIGHARQGTALGSLEGAPAGEIRQRVLRLIQAGKGKAQ